VFCDSDSDATSTLSAAVAKLCARLSSTLNHRDVVDNELSTTVALRADFAFNAQSRVSRAHRLRITISLLMYKNT
jgi:hypothetical protein